MASALGSGLGLVFLLLQQLQQQNASTQRFGPRAQTRRGPVSLCVEAFDYFAAEASKACANAYEISKFLTPEPHI